MGNHSLGDGTGEFHVGLQPPVPFVRSQRLVVVELAAGKVLEIRDGGGASETGCLTPS